MGFVISFTLLCVMYSMPECVCCPAWILALSEMFQHCPSGLVQDTDKMYLRMPLWLSVCFSHYSWLEISM